MVYVPTFEEHRQILSGESPIPEASGPSVGPGSAPSMGSGAAPATQPGQAETSVDYGAGVGFSTEGDLRDRLFNPVSQGLQQGQQGLSQATQDFYVEAGPERHFSEIGATQTLDQALLPGGDLGQARDLLGASYSGPGGLGYSGPYEGALEGRAAALGQGRGLQSIIQNSAPGITTGQARWEAKNLLGDQDYIAQTRDYQQEAQSYFDSLRQSQQQAQEYAARRDEQERGIATQSRDYVQGRRQSTLDELAGRASQSNARDEQVRQAYQSLLQGNMDQETANQGGIGAEFSRYNAALEPQRQAQQRLQDILAEYEGISDIEPARLTVTGRGREAQMFSLGGQEYRLDQAIKGRPRTSDGKNLDLPAGMTPEEFKDLAWQVHHRQRALEADFAPETNIVGNEHLFNEYPLTQQEAGQYHAYAPLYFQEAVSDPQYRLPTFHEYTQFDEGNAATRGNVASDNEVALVNRASDLLGEAERISNENPYRAAQIMMDIDGLLSQQESVLEARKDRLDEAGKEWQRAVKRARNQYNKQKDGILGGMMSLLGPALVGVAGASMGVPVPAV